jgi:phosphonopyruvate decarboxylase
VGITVTGAPAASLGDVLAGAVETLSGFVTGVPDSLLRDFVAALDTRPGLQHVVAANEGLAVSLACGWHLATGRVPVVYMQNSGLGNAVNPLLSLIHHDVYGIPMVILVGMRGWGGDAPQHVPQGHVTRGMLSSLGITVDGELTRGATARGAAALLGAAATRAAAADRPRAVIVGPGVLDREDHGRAEDTRGLTRSATIQLVVKSSRPGSLFVATTGYIARDLDRLMISGQCPDRPRFLVVGSMGHAGAIAQGLALAGPEERVICLDGDGAVAMHFGALITAGRYRPAKLLHVVLNNGLHESVGRVPTGLDRMDLVGAARACGYLVVERQSSSEGVADAMRRLSSGPGPALLEVPVQAERPVRATRPDPDLRGLKRAFMKRIQRPVSGRGS